MNTFLSVSTLQFCKPSTGPDYIAGFKFALTNGTRAAAGCDDSTFTDYAAMSFRAFEIITGFDLYMDALADNTISAITVHTNAAQYGPYGTTQSSACMTSVRGYSLRSVSGNVDYFLTQFQLQFERCDASQLVVADTCTEQAVSASGSAVESGRMPVAGSSQTLEVA